MKDSELENKLSRVFSFIQEKKSISEFTQIEKITQVSGIKQRNLLIFLKKNRESEPNKTLNEKFEIIYVKEIEFYNKYNSIHIKGDLYTPHYNFERAEIMFTKEEYADIVIQNNLLTKKYDIIREVYKIN